MSQGHRPPSRRAAIQRYAWAILDSREEGAEIVTGNLSRFMKGRTIPSATDTDIAGRTFDVANTSHEPVHLHGHGSSIGFAGLTPQTLAKKVRQKFGTSLKQRAIVFHSCEIGQGNYLRDFFTALIDGGKASDWKKTRIFGATRLLVVNTDGTSQVARAGVTEQNLKGSRNHYFHAMVERKARGWKVAVVSGNGIQVQDVTVGSAHYKELLKLLSKPRTVGT